MPDKILHKRNLISGNAPTTASLEPGELAINVADGKLFLRQSGSIANQIVTVGASASFSSTASYVNPLHQNIILSGALDLSPTSDPDYAGTITTDTFLFQSSSNTPLGYDLYIRQNGNLVKWKWVEGVLETGLLYGGVVTYSGSFVYVSSGSGVIAEHNASAGSEISPTITYVTWPAITQSITNIATQQVTYLYIDNNGNLQQQSTRFTSQQYHSYIPLGAVGHFDYTQVSAFGGGVQTAYDQISQISNFIDAFGPLKMSGYGLTGQPGSLRLSVGSGTSFIHGGFYQNDPEFPSQITTPSQATASLARVQRSGSVIEFDTNAGNFYTVVDPTQYDRDGDGILHSVGSGNWSIQRVFTDPKTGVLYVYYGQARYTNLLNALQYLPTDPFTEGDTFDFTTFVGFLVLKGNATNIADTANNSIINGGLFRGSGQGSGGGIALSNLDDLTDVTITTPSNGQALIYNSGTWENGTPSLATTASYVLQAVSASYALSSSFASTVPASGVIGLNLSQIATGSVTASVSPTQFTVTSGSSAEFIVTGTGVTIGNATTDAHAITGSLSITGSLRVTGSINGLLVSRGNGNVATNVSIGSTTAFSGSNAGNYNIAIGRNSLSKNTTGPDNTAIGRNTLYCNRNGQDNIALGRDTLYSNVSGNFNIALGRDSLRYNTSATGNTAIGNGALRSNTTGYANIAIGSSALRFSTTGGTNIALGPVALQSNSTGQSNVAIGCWALIRSSTGSFNTAIGRNTLGYINASNNIAIGSCALRGTVQYDPSTYSDCIWTGANNIALGSRASYLNTTGCYNTAIGICALSNNTTGNFNVVLGTNAASANATSNAVTSISGSIIIGSNTKPLNTTGDINEIVIGDNAIGLGSNTTVIGNSSTTRACIFGQLTATSFTGSLQGTASLALGVVGGISAFPFTGSARITGSLGVTGSISTSGSNGTINDLFIGRGGGNVATNISIGPTIALSPLTCVNFGFGEANVAIGSGSLLVNRYGFGNTGIGQSTLRNNTSGTSNTAIGKYALCSNTTGPGNTAIGRYALQSNTTGRNNTAIGQYSQISNTTGRYNLSIGYKALRYNTTACNNTAIGKYALYSNTTGAGNIALGDRALRANTTGASNVAIGYRALRCNTFARSNTAMGYCAMYYNTTGCFNNAIGHFALRSNTTGCYNVALGVAALMFNGTGGCNIALGKEAMRSGANGSHNVALGYRALYFNNANNNIGLGQRALNYNNGGTTNIAIGASALRFNTFGCNNAAIGTTALYNNTTGTNNTAIGPNALRGNTIGNTNITLGYKSNCAISGSQNNIVIGTNIGVAESSANRINIGALIFGSGSFSNSGSATFSGSSNGFVGINQPNPQYNLDVSGSFGLLQAAFVNQNTASLASGTRTISTNATGSFTSAFYQYTLASGSNARSGQVMSVWNGASIQFTDITTTDIGTTAAVALTASLSGANVVLSSTLPTSGWTIKTVVNLI